MLSAGDEVLAGRESSVGDEVLVGDEVSEESQMVGQVVGQVENAAMQTVRLRYFAAVAEAAGVAEESVSIAAGATAEQLREQLAAAHGAEFARVLGVSALLAEGRRLDGGVVVPQTDGIQVDVLPPFAGG